jgi:hypothetical protein
MPRPVVTQCVILPGCNNPEEPPLHGLACPPYHPIAKPAAKRRLP